MKALGRKPILSLSVGCTVLLFGVISLVSIPPATARSLNGPSQGDVIALGRALFRDKALSNPPGMACISCHSPETGYSYPNSAINKLFGTVPGVVPGRVGNRRPPSIAYAAHLLTGMPTYDKEALAFVGGLFWDGRVADSVEQAKQPVLNPNEMNGLVHTGGGAAGVVGRLRKGPSGDLMRKIYGSKIFDKPVSEVYDLVAKAISAYEASPEVSPFSSKYDAYLEGKAQLTPAELLGMRFTTGRLDGRPDGIPFRKSAHCTDCHGLSDDPTKGKDLWTNSCYGNLGVPRNYGSLYYSMTKRDQNPLGYNPSGGGYVDLGLGGWYYASMGMPELQESDPLGINGMFKAPSLRNVDKRPYPEFVKAYMHNGAFKSLKDVVHFYNTRNLTTYPGELIDLSSAKPYAHLKGQPLWARPEYPDNLINPTGGSAVPGMMTSGDDQQIGNLKLTDSQEDAIVAFLKCLSDGYIQH